MFQYKIMRVFQSPYCNPACRWSGRKKKLSQLIMAFQSSKWISIQSIMSFPHLEEGLVSGGHRSNQLLVDNLLLRHGRSIWCSLRICLNVVRRIRPSSCWLTICTMSYEGWQSAPAPQEEHMHSSFWIQSSSFLIQSPSYQIHNSSILIQLHHL